MVHQKTRSDDFDYENIAMDSSVLGDQTMASLERKQQLPTTHSENNKKPSPFQNNDDTDSIVTGDRPTDMAYIGDCDDVSTLANDTVSDRQTIIRLFPSISFKNKKGVDQTPERENTTNGGAQRSGPENSQNHSGRSDDDNDPKGDLEETSYRQLKYFIAAGFAVFLIGSIVALTLGFLNLKAQQESSASKRSFNEDQLDGGWDWTFKPTQTPSSNPTVSVSPSFAPSTSYPSSTPTTSVPSSSPSTPAPSVVPTMMPTPTAPTTEPPTGKPSRQPSSTPSQIPSTNPSGMPSVHPSGAPSQSPSKSPSAMPTVTQSGVPSWNPSENPTAAPSLSPSGLPTMTPSSVPTRAPTPKPSITPTAAPSSVPTGVPTFKPTKTPTASPTTSPPTMKPTTAAPTQMPSASPTMSKEETFRTFVGGASPAVLVDITQRGSVQEEVYDWLISDPDFYSYSEDRLIQRYVLAVFSLKLSGKNKLEYSNECDWFPTADGSPGCNDQGIRQNIVMRDQRIDGTLPTELYMLEKLKTLVMPNNELVGMLTDGIKGMKSLQVLDLSNNLHIGPIPGKIGDLKKLRILDLSNNSFDGVLPNSIGKLKDAKEVMLNGNFITGPIPIDIRKMQKLVSLDLRRNQLTGTIPLEMMQMVKLQELQLTENRLSGVVNATFCQPLVNLAVFSTDCQVGGSVTCSCCTNCGSDASTSSTNFDSAVSQSAMIQITEVAAPNLRGSTDQSPSFVETPACENKVKVTKTCFESGNDIRVHFTNCDARDDDWIGLYNSNADPQKLAEPILWLETCGSQDCGQATGRGSVYFEETIAAGSYKAFLVSKGPIGESYKSFAESGEILVQDSC